MDPNFRSKPSLFCTISFWTVFVWSTKHPGCLFGRGGRPFSIGRVLPFYRASRVASCFVSASVFYASNWPNNKDVIFISRTWLFWGLGFQPVSIESQTGFVVFCGGDESGYLIRIPYSTLVDSSFSQKRPGCTFHHVVNHNSVKRWEHPSRVSQKKWNWKNSSSTGIYRLDGIYRAPENGSQLDLKSPSSSFVSF